LRSRIYILGLVFLIVLLAVGSCRKAGGWLVKSEEPVHADVMVMLTGRITDRVLQVDDLYKQNVAGKVWIVEPGKGDYQALEERGVQIVSEITLIRNALIDMGIPQDSIVVLPGNATSTMMEAEAVREYLQTQTGIDTLLLVSSSSHTLRAFKIFKAAFRAMEEPPVVCCSPSIYTQFHAERWWKSKDDVQQVAEEYLKLLNYALFEKRKLRSGSKE